MSPGLAKRVTPPATSPSTQTSTILTNSQTQYTSNEKLNGQIKPSSDQTTRIIKQVKSNNSISSSSNPNNAQIKIQNALEKNMQKLNLAGQINKTKPNSNLTKEDIELFSSSSAASGSNGVGYFTSDSLSSTPEHQLYNNYNAHTTHLSSVQLQNFLPPNLAQRPTQKNQILSHQQQQYILDQGLSPELTSYYLNRLPGHGESLQQTNNLGKTQNQILANPLLNSHIIGRNSNDREMTPDSIDNENENIGTDLFHNNFNSKSNKLLIESKKKSISNKINKSEKNLNSQKNKLITKQPTNKLQNNQNHVQFSNVGSNQLLTGHNHQPHMINSQKNYDIGMINCNQNESAPNVGSAEGETLFKRYYNL